MTKISCKPVTFGGPTDEGKPYSNFKESIKKGYGGERFLGNEDLSVEIKLYIEKDRIKKNYNDLDNFLKPIIDALAENKVLEEEHIAKIIIKRILVDADADEGVDIVINRIDKNQNLA